MDVKRKSNRVMVNVLTLGREVITILSAVPIVHMVIGHKESLFFDEMANDLVMESSSKITFSLGI